MAEQVIFILYTTFMGAWTACFIGCAAYRLPRGESVEGRSHCEACNHQLSWDIAPVIGWLALGGKCRFCRSPVSAIYPLCEAALALVFLIQYEIWGMSLRWLAAAGASSFALYIALCVGYFHAKLPVKASIAFIICALCTWLVPDYPRL